jgi:hypothetical protein
MTVTRFSDNSGGLPGSPDVNRVSKKASLQKDEQLHILARLRTLPKTGAGQFDQRKFEEEGSMDQGLPYSFLWFGKKSTGECESD